MPSNFDGTIDCAQDFVPQIDCERLASTTGAFEPYTPLTSVTMLLAATRGSDTAIHASLSKSASERTGTPGRIYANFDVADLQTHLQTATYRGKIVFLNVFKSGELQYEPFRMLVAKDRLGT